MRTAKPTYDELLQQNENLVKLYDFQKTILDYTVDWEILLSPTGEFSYCSPSCIIISGYEANEFTENPNLFLEIIHPLDREIVNQHFYKKRNNIEKDSVLEFRMITKDGIEKWIEHFCRKVYDKSGEFVGYRSSNRDITKRKEAEFALKQTNTVLTEERQIFTQGNVVVFKWKNSENWPVEYVSQNVKSVFGFTPEEMQSPQYRYSGFIFPEDLERVASEVAKFSSREENYFEHEPYRVIGKNGEIHWISDYTVILRNDTGEITHYIGYLVDISKLKKAEETLRADEERLALVLKGAELGLWDWHIPTGDVVFNERWANMLGYALDEIEPNAGSWEKLMHPDDMESVSAVLTAHLEGRIPVYRTEHRLLAKSGEWKWILDTGKVFEWDEQGKPVRMLGIHQDITDRKLAHEELRESEENLFITLNSIGDGVIATDERGMVTRMNPVAEKLCGWPIAAALRKPLTEVFKIMNAQTRELVKNPVDLVMEKGVTIGLANHTVLISKDGKEYQIADSAAPIKDKDGKIIGVILVFTDVTEEYNTKQILVENEKRYRAVFQNSPIGIMLLDETGIICDVNEANAIITGYSIDELIGSDVRQLAEPENVYSVDLDIKRILSGELLEHEVISCRKDGSRSVLSLRETAILLPNGKPGILSISSDITESKRVNNLLHESEEKYRFIAENTAEVITLLDLNLMYTYISPAVFRQRGYTVEEAMSQKLEEATTPATMNRVYQLFAEELANETSGTANPNRSRSLELEQYCKDGSTIWIDVSLSFTRDVNGKATGIFAVSRDITKRKQAEDKLIESEERFRKMFNNHAAIMLVIDPVSGAITDANTAAQVFYGYSHQQLCALKIYEINQLSKDDVDREIRDAKNEQRDYFIFPHKLKNGKIRTVEVRSSPIEINNKKMLFSIIQDITERKQAEEEIRKLSRLVESTTQAVMISDMELNIIYVNQALLDLGGFNNQNELIGKSAFLYTDEEGKMKLHDEVLPAILLGGSYHGEIILKKKENSVFPAEINCSVITDETGVPIYLTAIFDDITARKQAEEALLVAKEKAERNERQYYDLYTLMRLMSDTVPDMLWAKNLDKEFIFVNEAICTGLLNATGTEEPLGKTDMFFAMRERNSQPDNPEWHTFGEICRDSDAATLEAMEPMQFDEFGNVKGKFLFLDVHKAPLYDNTGQLIGVVGSARDITAAKAAENQLRKLSWAVEQSPASVVITNTEGTIEYVNPKFTKVTGYTSEEAIGQNPRISKSGEQAPEVYTKLWQTISAGKEWKGELHNKKKNGELYWESILISPIINEKGEILYFLGVKEDITEKKKMFEELVAAKDHAEESDQLKSAFLANMSHEIRTPMNGILGFAELLKEPELTGEEQQEYIRIIEKSGKRMLNIINDIVDISKIEAGLMEFYIQETIVNDQLEYTYNFFKPEADAKGIDLIFKNAFPAKGMTIKTDREKLYAILTNLVKNAIKYTEKGSIVFGYEKKDKYLEFYVKDTGIGISKDRQEAIFERFIQADITNKMANQGAGLGLAITKAYIEMLGGKIWVESNERNLPAGQAGGSTFYFTLPYKPKSTAEIDRQPEPSEKNETVRKLKILIAEDDETSEILIYNYIKTFGKDILKARTGIEAVEACRNNADIDLVLMDIRMPEMGGYQATKQIREFNQEVIIIAQTAYGLTGDREKAIEAGCNDYIAKPISKDKLLALIKKYFVK